MNIQNKLGLFLGMVIVGLTGLWFVGCVAQDKSVFETLANDRQLRDASPETTVWVQNLSGVAIREVGMSCKSAGKGRSYGTSWTRETTIEREPKEIWREKYPDPLVLETLRVLFDNGAPGEFVLNHCCQPGDQVLLVIDVGGRVTVKAKD